ncbi:MAG: hypothetical protein JO189_02820 [Deltaproteobacteria bacterium]|nr:hypothetical protein [Deltaproteobacteria bacterium]
MDSTYNNEMSWVSWMTPVDDEPTRESWLLSAIDRMARSLFPAFKPPKWRVTCGWPKGVRGGKHAIGQCWDRTASNDGTYEICAKRLWWLVMGTQLSRPNCGGA